MIAVYREKRKKRELFIENNMQLHNCNCKQKESINKTS